MLKLWISLQDRIAELRKEDGQAMTEYGLILALIAVVVVGVVAAIGLNLLDVFGVIRDNL
jgi:pilus assembly protein Flp/PilA